MYRKVNDFIADWNAEQEFTISVFSKINPEKMSLKIKENIRNLGRLAWHIVQTVTEMPHKAGLIEMDYLDNKPIPSTFPEIISIYKKYSEEMVENVHKKWTDTDLLEVIEVYGQKWEKRKILSALINHQIHHRAQMIVLMRMQNIEIPGIYGPAKEEWKKYGMEPPE